MKSAIFVSEQRDVLALFVAVLEGTANVSVVDDQIHVERDGVHALFYELPGGDWHEPGTDGRDFSSYHAVMVECRDEALVVDPFVNLAAPHPTKLLLLDSSDTVWTAETVHTDTLML